MIAKLKPTGELLIEELNGEPSGGVAVDPSNEEPLVDNLKSIAVFDTTGNLTDTFGSGQITSGAGMAAAKSGEPNASNVLVADPGANAVRVFVPEPPGPPKIEELSVASITAMSAKLTALIDPTGNETEYSFRYDTSAVPTASEPCTGTCTETPPASIGKGFSDVSVEPEVKGLTPGKTYHYRVIANNSAGAAESGEQTFKTPPEVFGATLPDGRVWELVSPTNKNGAAIEPLTAEGEAVQAAEDGEGIVYAQRGALPGAEGNRVPEPNEILATRGGTQWSYTDLDTPTKKAKA